MKRFPLFLLLVILGFSSCKQYTYLSNIESGPYKLSAESEIKPDQEIVKVIQPYKEKLDAEMNEVIGISEMNLTKAKPESTLGNWVSDLLKQKTEDYYGQDIDFAVVNYGGLRIPTLPKGNITKGKIYELMPFDNMIVVVHLDFATMQKMFDKMAEKGGWPISAEVRYEIANGKAKNITIKGKSIDKNSIYKMGISDYIANGGDGCDFLKSRPTDNTGRLLRDSFLEFVTAENKAGRKLQSQLDERVKIR